MQRAVFIRGPGATQAVSKDDAFKLPANMSVLPTQTAPDASRQRLNKAQAAFSVLSSEFSQVPIHLRQQEVTAAKLPPAALLSCAFIQAKLKVGAVDDPLEHEADRVADQVTRTPDPKASATCLASAPQSEMQAGGKKDEDTQRLQIIPRSALRSQTSAFPYVAGHVVQSSGQMLDADVRAYFEPRFGHDFSAVRVHTDDCAAASAASMGASAFTVGSSIAFAAGRYDPDTPAGRRLLAHELTHVVQQRSIQQSGAFSEPLLIQRNAESDDYMHGYEDGLDGGDSRAGPRDVDVLVDYNEGYAKGHYQFIQHLSSGDSPTGSIVTPSPAAVSTPEHNGPNSDEYKQGYEDGLKGSVSHAGPRAGEGLVDYNEGFAKGRYQFNNGTAVPALPDTTLAPTGVRHEATPQSLQFGGLPAFRFNAPPLPIATAVIQTLEATIKVALSLRGSVTVTFPSAPRGVSTDIDTGGWRVAATQALGPLTQGFRVNGIGTKNPTIGVTLGSDYNTSEFRFEPPNSMLFIGQARVDYSVPSGNLGQVAVQGQAGFEMKVTVTPHPRSQPAPVDTQQNWFQAHAGALAAVGGIILVGIAVAAAPETGGGSLVILAVP